MQTPGESQANDSVEPHGLPPRMGWFRRLIADVVFVAKRDKKIWLLPLILLMLLFAALLAIAVLAGPLAPFIYPLL